MIWHGNGDCELEKGEPGFRSCWVCNPGHGFLKTRNRCYLCPFCGRYFLLGKFADDVLTNEAFDSWMVSLGLKPGESTTKVIEPIFAADAKLEYEAP